jgi:hypothetical protein
MEMESMPETIECLTPLFRVPEAIFRRQNGMFASVFNEGKKTIKALVRW